MAEYQHAVDAIDGNAYSGVIRTSDGAWVACAGPDGPLAHSAWTDYLAWLGPPDAPVNTTDPYLAPAEGGAVIVLQEGQVAYGAMLASMPDAGVVEEVLPPTNTSVPFVGGIGAVGETLTCTMGNWTGEPTAYAYEWTDGTAILVGLEDTYMVTAGDVGSSIYCTVTATNAAGSTAAPLSNVVVIAGAVATEAAAHHTTRSGSRK